MEATRANQISRIITAVLNALSKLRMVCRSRCCDSECRMNEKNISHYIENEDTK